MASQAEAQEAKNKNSARLLATPGVAGVGVERDDHEEWLIVVHLDQTASDTPVPASLDGVPVRTVADGPYHAGPARG
jgi:hypothetical protein